MKKGYTLVLTGYLFTLSINSIFAQAPTITAAMLPNVGTTYNQINDSNHIDLPTFTIMAGSASAQTWNYVPNFVTTYSSTNSFISPTGLTGASNFPNATLGNIKGTNTLFYATGASGLVLDGVYNATLTSVYTPPEVIFPTPFTYGNISATSFSCTTNTSSGGYMYETKQHSTRKIIADAFGSLTTPAGTYTNTLRLKIVEVDRDTEFVYSGAALIATLPTIDSTCNYQWVETVGPHLIMQLNLNKLQTKVTSAYYVPSETMGIQNNTSPFAELSLYPNPATTAANLSYENKNATHIIIQLLDINGKLITTLANENQSAGKQTILIDTKALVLNAGMYFVRISGSNGSEIVKLSVN